MTKYTIAAIIFILTSCSNSNTNLKVNWTGMSTKPLNVLDSLKSIEGFTKIETRKYKTDSDSQELIIYNYKHSGDGVYELNDSSYGRLYTLRGDAENPDAVVYQLVPFNGGKVINLLYQKDKLLLLNEKFEKPKQTTSNNIYLNVNSN